MMISIFLAKALGLYLVIISTSMLVNHALFKKIIHEMAKSPALMLLNGVFALMIGILLVLSHNIWMLDWRVLITLLAWITLWKGIVCTAFPQWIVTCSEKFTKSLVIYRTASVIYFLIGVFLCFWGFEFNMLTGYVE